MTDPLSISASIAGLVTLADVVFGRVYKYTKSVKSASKEITTLSSEIGALYGILSNLRLLTDQLERETCEFTPKAYHIHSCFETLQKVKDLLDKDSAGSSQSQDPHTLKQKLKWPLKASEVKDLIAEIGRHKATLALALSADVMSALLRALSTQAEIEEGIKSIRTEQMRRREAEVRVAIDENRQKVLDSFGSLHTRQNHDMSRKLCHPGTGLWFTEGFEFKSWQTSRNAHLWVYGIPGAGKTVLASLIIDEILRMTTPSTAAAYFYCDYKDPATQEPHKILGSLVQQLAKQDEKSFVKVQKFYDIHGQGRKSPVAYEPQQLCSLIREIVADYDCTMIAVDGLDECGANAYLVTELLSSLNVQEEEDIDGKLIFLSRDEVDIRRCLEGWPSISIAAQSSDLKLYVGAEIETRTRKKFLNIKTAELKNHIMERLVDGAEGMYVPMISFIVFGLPASHS